MMPRRYNPSPSIQDTPLSSWQAAFGAQARSDYETHQLLRRSGLRLCHQLHYLQMAAEKLGKAFFAGSECPGRRPPNIHTAFTRFLRMARRMQSIRAVCGFAGRDSEFFGRYIGGLVPLAREVERLAPKVGGPDSPNTEYPWLHNGRIVSPLDYSFPAMSFGSPLFRRLLQFIEACLTLV